MRPVVPACLVVLALTASACRGTTPASRQPLPSTSTGPADLVPTPASSPNGEGALPAPDEPIPGDPISLAAALETTTRALNGAIDRWVHGSDPAKGTPPEPVVLLALYEQRIYGTMVARPGLARRVIALLPRSLAAEARANTAAGAKLSSLTAPISPATRFRTGRPDPAGVLLRSFKEAEGRFGVRWKLLAAVMFVESKFGRTRSGSGAGAQGPMQFLPQTWAAYGMGGNIQDPHDAILGAANYLHRSGAPGNDRAALYAYNHAWEYVEAVLLFADQMRRDVRDYYAYYNWQVFVRTTSGVRRVTGPGL
jgi:hypothetical protein